MQHELPSRAPRGSPVLRAFISRRSSLHAPRKTPPCPLVMHPKVSPEAQRPREDVEEGSPAPNTARRALAAARVAAAARSFSDSEAATENVAPGCMPCIVGDAPDRRVRWSTHLSSSSLAAGELAVLTADRNALSAAAIHTDGGSSGAGEDACRLRVRRSRRQQQQGEGSGSKRPGKHKQRRWLHQQLLVAALRRLMLAGGEYASDEADSWGGGQRRSCWERMQEDPVARDLYVKRKDVTCGPLAGSLRRSADSSAPFEGQEIQQPDPLLQRRSHCIRLMTKQQQQQKEKEQEQHQQRKRRPMLRAASADGLTPSHLLHETIPVDTYSGTDCELLPEAASALSTASLLAHELEEQRLLLLQLEGSDLQLLPSVQRMKALHAAFKPLKPITRDAVLLFSLSAALESAIRDVYPYLASGGGGLKQLLQEGTAAGTCAAQQQTQLPKVLPDATNLNTSTASTSCCSRPGLRCMRLVRETEGPKVEHMAGCFLSTEELQLLSFVERMHQHSAAGNALGDGETAEGEKREWLLLWRLSGFERKVAHALLALSSDIESFSVAPSDMQRQKDEHLCTPRQQQPQHYSRRKARGNKDKVLVVCRKQHPQVNSLPPVSLAVLLVCAVTASI